MKKFLKVLLIIAVIIVALVLVVMFVLNNQTKAESIKLGDDVIPTVYSIVGERKIVGSFVGAGTGSGQYKTFVYDRVELSDEDLNQYCSALLNKDFYVTKNEGDTIQLAKESLDVGDIILVDINVTDEECEIKYTKIQGELTIY